MVVVGRVCVRGMHGRGCVAEGTCMVGGVRGGGACVAGGHAWQGGMCGVGDITRYGQ